MYKCIACGSTALERDQIVKFVSADADLLAQQLVHMERLIQAIDARLQRFEANARQTSGGTEDLVGGNE